VSGRLRVAVLVSGEGTTAEALILRFADAGANAEVVLALADRPCPAVVRLASLGVPTRIVPKAGSDRTEWAAEMVRSLVRAHVELVVLGGFLSVVPAPLLERFGDRVINVHPALLPKYGGRGMFGAHVHEAVLRDGVSETGVTVHLVTPRVDAGPILWQRAVPVGGATTPEELRERVRPLEVEGLSTVIEAFARLGHAPPEISPR
jgi:phosphoribosylglycinamide formyltransferase-1